MTKIRDREERGRHTPTGEEKQGWEKKFLTRIWEFLDKK